MIYKTNNVNINYIDYGSKDGKPIVFLHGWGQNIEMMKYLSERFKNNRLIVIDLPGHGQSSVPTYPWTIYEYEEAINNLLESINVSNPVLIGHSFGGKISIIYASKHNVDKLVLLASPFKASKKKNSLKVKVFKTLMKVPLLNKLGEEMKKHIGSEDYKNASPVMREILVKHINTDVSNDASKIKAPTLLIWGTNDEAVPFEDAFELEKLIEDSAVIPFEGATHYAYIEHLNEVVRIIKNFIGGKK